MDQPSQEERPLARFGVSASVLQQAEHLRDVVFPKAGVQLFIQDRSAYAVTRERLLLPIGPLETLVQMTDREITDRIRRVVEAHQPRSERDLRELRVEAGFLTQEDFAVFINQQAESLYQKPVISSKTIWRAENGHPIAATKALLILAALKTRGVHASLSSVSWVIGHQGKRTKKDKQDEERAGRSRGGYGETDGASRRQ